MASAVQVIDQVIEAGHGSMLPESDKPEEWAAAIQQALISGKFVVLACIVLGMPLMPEGPLRPVTLPCCGVAVSHAGAGLLLRAGVCQVCKSPLAADAQLPTNEAVTAAVRAESNGFKPKVLQRGDVEIDVSPGSKIGSGGEGKVVRGTLRGGRAVAVKQIPLPAVVEVKDSASVKQVVSASYIAGLSSPYMCTLYGYCWTDAELWCAHCRMHVQSSFKLHVRVSS